MMTEPPTAQTVQERPPRTGDAARPVLRRVLDAFHRQKVAYCYWKSSRRLDEVLAGDGDVDLLIAAADWQRALAIALQGGFKLCPSESDWQHSGTLSLLGHDEETGRLLHLHLHARVAIGDRWLRNYVVPWDKTLLERSVLDPVLGIRVLDPASEAVLLAVRALIELGGLDPLAPWYSPAKRRGFDLDQRALACRLDRGSIGARAGALVGADLAAPLAEALLASAPITSRRDLARRLRAMLACYRTYNGIEAQARRWARSCMAVAGWVGRRHLHVPRAFNRRAPGGGCIVAVLGVDGSGKSTAVAHVHAWLGAKLDVLPIYFGTGDGRPSLLLWPFKFLLPLALRVLGERSGRATAAQEQQRSAGKRPLYWAMLAVWATAVAMEKRQKLRVARRAANRGLVVVTDRFPQDQIPGFNDGPLLAQARGLPSWLRQREAESYALSHRLCPDLVIKLIARPDTIAGREPDLHPANIPGRIANLQRLEFPRSRVVCIDAEEPVGEMLRAIRREVWRQI